MLKHNVIFENFQSTTFINYLKYATGWSLGEHSEWSKFSNFDVAVRVPLLFSIPNITFRAYDDSKLSKEENKCKTNKKYCGGNRIISEPVELLDLFPTIAELAAIPIPMCPRGKSKKTMPILCSEGSSLVPLIEASLACKKVRAYISLVVKHDEMEISIIIIEF